MQSLLDIRLISVKYSLPIRGFTARNSRRIAKNEVKNRMSIRTEL